MSRWVLIAGPLAGLALAAAAAAQGPVALLPNAAPGAKTATGVTGAPGASDAEDASGARAAPGASVSGTTLHAGEVVETSWTGTPATAREVELLLSLDGGRTFALRITPALVAESGFYSWRVPPLPAPAARLALRANLDGREVISGLSAPFRIAVAGPVYGWSIEARDGELWLDGPADSVAPADRLGLVPGAPSRLLAPRWPGAAPLPPSCRHRLGLARAELADGRHDGGGGAAPRPASGAATAQPPIAGPLRI